VSKPLTSSVIARWAAVHGFELRDAVRMITVMSLESRANVSSIYADDDLLTDDQRILADSMQVRHELAEMTRRCRSPHAEGTPEWHLWHRNSRAYFPDTTCCNAY
jgi:hypothetical protein